MRPAYFETSIEGKFSRDPQTVDMVNLIVSNRTFDIGVVFEIGNIKESMINSLKSDTLSASSYVSANSEMYELEIVKTVELLK